MVALYIIIFYYTDGGKCHDRHNKRSGRFLPTDNVRSKRERVIEREKEREKNSSHKVIDLNGY